MPLTSRKTVAGFARIRTHSNTCRIFANPATFVGFTFLLSCWALVATAATDWPQFRGPTGDGKTDAKNVPVEWSASDHVEWKQPIPGVGWSSPVLAGGKLFLTTAVSDADEAVSLRALCVNAANGHFDWNVEIFRPEGAAAKEMHSKNSMASPTPIVEGDRLYVHFGHMGTAALDLAGNIIWRQTSLAYHPQHGNGGSPILCGELLIFSADGKKDPFVAALDRVSGAVRWSVPRNTTAAKTFSFSTPTEIEVDGSKQVISAGSGYVAAYEPADGHEIWRVRYGEGYSVVPRPVFANGLLFLASGYDRSVLYAIDPKGAQGDATDTAIVWTLEKGAPLTPSVLVVGDELYFVSDNGVATCIDAHTKKNHWTKRLGGDYSASPILAEGRIYFQNEAGVTTVVKAGTEYESLSVNDIGERTLASPIATDGAIFIRSELHLWRIGE
jgi:outer membrane protein assembly factor BamB